jgi:hypothetical protein
MKSELNEVSRFKKIAGLMKESQLEETKLSKLDNAVANLYAYTNIDPNYDYDAEIVRKFGQDTVDRALELAPQILAYKEKLKQIAKEIENSNEGKILLAMVAHSRGYGGSREISNIGDLFRF